MTAERVRIFSNGEKHRAWLAANCDGCTKYDAFEPPTCEIDAAVLAACIDDGTVSAQIADRMGYKPGPPFELGWDCPEKVQR